MRQRGMANMGRKSIYKEYYSISSRKYFSYHISQEQLGLQPEKEIKL